MDPNTEQLERLGTLVRRHHECVDMVDAATETLKGAKAQLRTVEEVDIPTLMDECGLLSVVATDGSKVTISEIITASIPKAKRPVVATWLVENGLAALINHNVSASFSHEDAQAAQELTIELAKRELNTDYEMNFNTSSLKAAIRERLREGKPVDFDLLGIFNVRKAIVKEPK